MHLFIHPRALTVARVVDGVIRKAWPSRCVEQGQARFCNRAATPRETTPIPPSSKNSWRASPALPKASCSRFSRRKKHAIATEVRQAEGRCCFAIFPFATALLKPPISCLNLSSKDPLGSSKSHLLGILSVQPNTSPSQLFHFSYLSIHYPEPALAFAFTVFCHSFACIPNHHRSAVRSFEIPRF